MDGFLHVDKPSGLTSRQVVDRAQRALGGARVGHAGTLDPLAEGVLVLAVGQATRLIRYVQQMPKTYRATFLLGRVSDTDDLEGMVRMGPEGPAPDEAEVRRVLAGWVGRVEQVPPAYSAAKVQGRRAYALARAGRRVELASRQVHIERLELVRYAYPELVVDVRCGAGTYIRSLGRDVGGQLGVGGLMSGLIREAVGPFDRRTAVAVDDLAPGRHPPLQPLAVAVAGLPVRQLSDADCQRVAQGGTVPADGVAGPEIAGIDGLGRLRAILVPRGPGRLGPVRNFLPVTAR